MGVLHKYTRKYPCEQRETTSAAEIASDCRPCSNFFCHPLCVIIRIYQQKTAFSTKGTNNEDWRHLNFSWQ